MLRYLISSPFLCLSPAIRYYDAHPDIPLFLVVVVAITHVLMHTALRPEFM